MKSRLTLLIIIRSIVFWLIMSIIMLGFAVLLICLCSQNLATKHRFMIKWSNYFAFFAKYLCGVKYKVYGLENLPAGAAIIASNHQSMWETFMFSVILPPHVWILKQELLKIPLFGWVLSALEPIAIDRKNHNETLQQVIKQSAVRFKYGLSVLIFPEGTRARSNKLLTFKVGVVKIASTLRVPIVPVSHNAGYVLPKGGFCLYPGTVTVVIGKSIYLSDNIDVKKETQYLQTVVATNLPYD